MPRGRPKAEINFEELEKLAGLQCTQDEIASWFKVDRRTIIRLFKKPEVQEVVERGKAAGRTSLRRAQFTAAMKGNPALLIWLGKQILGQKETLITEHSGEMTINDGAKDKLISKLAGVLAAKPDTEGDPLIN